MEDALDGGPGVSDGKWVLSASFMRLLMNFLAESRAAGGLQDERNKIDVLISIKFDLLCSHAIVTDLGRCWLLQ